MFQKLTVSAAIAAALAASPSAASATSFNAVNDFSLASNPNGAWTYLANGVDMSATSTACEGVTGFSCWNNGGTHPNLAIVGQNTTGASLSGVPVIVTVPTDHLDLAPQNVANVTVRWTAPTGGTYVITGDFLGLALNEQAHTVALDKNGVSLVSLANMETQGQSDPFATTLALNTGDTIDFVVNTGFGDGPDSLDTGLAVSISTVPEPSTAALLVAGLFGFGLVRRRG